MMNNLLWPYVMKNRLPLGDSFRDGLRKFVVKDLTDKTLLIGVECIGKTETDMSVVADKQVITIKSIVPSEVDSHDEETDDVPESTTPHTYETVFNELYLKPIEWKVAIPCEYDPSQATAKVENGLCVVTIPARVTQEGGVKIL